MALRREITARITDLLAQNPQGLSITEIVQKSGINRNTAGRYLDNLLITGQVEMRHFGMAKIYSLSHRLPVASVLSVSSELVLQLDASLRIVFINEPFSDLLGGRGKESLGKNIEFSPVHPFFDEAFPEVYGWIKDGLSGTEYRGELDVPSQGKIFLCRITPTVSDSGQKGVSVLFEDITDRKKSEARIRESEARLRSIIRVAPIGIGVVSGRIFLEVNEQFCRITGYDAGELVGHSAQKLYPAEEEFSRVGGEYFRQIQETGSASVETQWRRKDGETVDILLNATPLNPRDLGAGITFTALDITRRMKAIRAVRESEARLNLALAGSDIGMWEMDIPSRVQTVDDRAAGILGRRQEDSRSQSFDWSDILYPDDRLLIRNLFLDCLEGRTPFFETEHRIRRSPGEWIWVNARGKITHRFPDGSPLRMTGTIQDITRRKMAEEALRESEEKFRTLVNNADDIITLHETGSEWRHGKYIEVNDAACRKLGYSREELLGMAPGDLVTPEFREVVLKNAEKLKEDGHVSYETFLTMKNGRQIPVEINAHVFDFRGRRRVLALIRDTTERKRAEESLRLLKISVDNAYDEVFWMDFRASFLYVNDAACRATGYSREELLAMKVYALDPDFTPERWEESIADLRKNRKQFFRTRHRRKDGVILDVEIGSIYVTRGAEEYAFCFVRDITEQKRTDEALRESEARYRSLSEASQDMIFVIDRDDTVLYVNRKAADFLGKTAEEIIGRPRGDNFPPEVSAQQYAALQHVFATGFEVRNEGPITVRGEMRWFDHALVPVPDSRGQVASVLGVSRDITRRKLAELAQQQNEQSNQFIAEHSVDIIHRLTPDCTCIYASPSVTARLGYAAEDVIGKSALPRVHPDDLPGVIKNIAEIRASGQNTITSTLRYRHRDGHYLWFESTTRIIRDAAGEVREFISISRDITDRKSRQQGEER